MSYIIEVNRGDEAGVWCAVCDDVRLAPESNSFDAPVQKVKIAAHETLEMNGQAADNAGLCFKLTHRGNIAL